MIKKILLFIICTFFYANAIADKYVGRGELKFQDVDVENFMNYLNSPPHQYPMVFLVIVEEGKAIWSAYWYCPEANCMTLSKPKATRQCAKDAEKFYKDKKYLECFIFAKKKVVVWDNYINTGHYKESSFKSKWDKPEVLEKLSELGFMKDPSSSGISNKTNPDMVKKLNSLKKLYDTGALSKKEFEKAKKKILD